MQIKFLATTTQLASTTLKSTPWFDKIKFPKVKLDGSEMLTFFIFFLIVVVIVALVCSCIHLCLPYYRKNRVIILNIKDEEELDSNQIRGILRDRDSLQLSPVYDQSQRVLLPPLSPQQSLMQEIQHSIRINQDKPIILSKLEKNTSLMDVE